MESPVFPNGIIAAPNGIISEGITRRESPALGAAETVGQYLRRHREGKRVSIEEVALHTRIQAVFIDAIEEDRFDKIASLVSAKGFVRSYCRYLKLDESETLQRFSESIRPKGLDPIRNAILDKPAPAPLNFPKLEPGSGMRPLNETPALTALNPKRVSRADSYMGTIGVRTRLPHPYTKLIGMTVVCLFAVFLLKLFIPWGNKKSEILIPDQTRLETPVLRDTPPPAAAVMQTPAVVAPEPAPEEDSSMAATLLNATMKPLILSLEAREPTWVKVLVDGKGTKDVLLRTGEKAVWQADKTFLLTMGNGGGAEVFLDGKELGFLGKKGEVVRDRLLTRVASDQTAVNDD